MRTGGSDRYSVYKSTGGPSQSQIDNLFRRALRHHQDGQLAQAQTLYRQILSLQSEHVGAIHYLGVIACQSGNLESAIKLIRQAIALRPDYAEAHNSLGNALKDRGQLDQAIAAYRQASMLNPDLPESHSNLGDALKDNGQLDEAITAYRQAIVLRPNDPEIYSSLGYSLKVNGQLEKAIAAYRRAVALNPNLPGAHNNLGNLLKDKGQLDEAIGAYQQALALNPKLPEAFNNLGIVLKKKGQLDQAIAAYRQAIVLRPNYPEALSNLGKALREKIELDEAIAAGRQAVALNPNLPGAHINLGNALKDTGLLDEAIAAYRHAISIDPRQPSLGSNLAYILHFHPDYDGRAIAEEQARWNRQYAAPFRWLIQPHENDRDPDRRLRIGYVSPDFRAHPVGRFLLPLLAHHDKQQVEVFVYSGLLAADELTGRLRSHVDVWRDIVGLSDERAVELIRQDRIDILVDLTMHTANNRLLVFARKPAPVQITYLAYCSSTGLETIDYRLSDPYMDPPGMDESIYSERTIRLPDTYWCYEPIISNSDVTPLPALERGFVIFGSLNNFCKVSEPALAAWIQLLRNVPSSKLLLHACEGSHRRRVCDRLQREGIDPVRLRFAGFMPTQQYFELYHEIDIGLDTFPYGGGTTTCDALWMGVPVVSLAGRTAVGRGGVSILSNIGLTELVAASPDTYVRLASDLAGDLPRLRDLRSTLRERMEQSPLMDGARFATNVEAAYREMWHTWCGSPR